MVKFKKNCRQNKVWTNEEIDILKNAIGTFTFDEIAKKLGRSTSATKQRAKILKLKQIDSFDGLTAPQLEVAFNASKNTVKNWFTKYGLKQTNQKIHSNRDIYTTNLTLFWEWAENNKHIPNWSKLDKYALGKEPEWLIKLRLHPERILALNPKMHWSKSLCKSLLIDFNSNMSISDLSEKYGRSERCILLKLKSITHIKSTRITKNWSTKEITQLKKLYFDGLRDKDIASILNRSTRSISKKRIQENLLATSLWTDEEVTNLYLYKSKKYSINKIARKLNRTEVAVVSKLNKVKKSK